MSDLNTRLKSQARHRRVGENDLPDEEAVTSLRPSVSASEAVHRTTQPAEPARPVAWVVFDEIGDPLYCASYEEVCHEHINYAIAEHAIDEAARW